MRGWAILLGGLIVWAAHFFALYIIASLFPGSDTARWLTLVASIGALIADGLIIRLVWNAPEDEFDRWTYRLGAAGAGLSLVAVIWQGLPAILV